MTINYSELNATRDRIEGTWMTGFETAEAQDIVGPRKDAGNRYLDELKKYRFPP